VVAPNVLEALILAALGRKNDSVHADDLLEIISAQKMDPRVVYPSGSPRRVNRFAFVIHPLSKEFLKKDKAVDMLSNFTPPAFLDAVEKVIAYAPPWVYSRVTGIKSPQGVEAEGWLLTVGGTPKQMLAHSPEFTYSRLLQAARMAKRMGAQIMGLGAFTKVVGDAGVTVAKKADIPITTGNSYSASGALWAAADAVRRMGLIKIEKGKRIRAKTMVLGATGAIGSVCCRLLAKAFYEIVLVGRNTAKLLALKNPSSRRIPDVKITVTTRPDKYLKDMDVIVTATSGAGKKVLDITQVKPGCVITDVARPLDLSPEDVAKRPDVLVIESGEIELPGNPEMKNIGLPDKVAYACLAETIVLALEGRFEVFTIGRDIEWEKVKTIYKLGLKHGMKLAAISGVNGVFTDEDIARVKTLALEARTNAIQLAEVAVKRIIQISLGPSLDDNEFETRFLDQSFSIQRFGTDGDVERPRLTAAVEQKSRCHRPGQCVSTAAGPKAEADKALANAAEAGCQNADAGHHRRHPAQGGTRMVPPAYPVQIRQQLFQQRESLLLLRGYESLHRPGNGGVHRESSICRPPA
jgi:predicted amino acid dehydrogenase